MPLPVGFVQHLRDFGYHPRSDKHSNALAAAIVSDLLAGCDLLRSRAEAGRTVYQLNANLRVSNSTWNVDLVFGPPAGRVEVPAGLPIARATPAVVQIAIEIKAVMTEHRKAVKNRKRDFEAHHEHVHGYDSLAVAAGVMVVNASTSFLSPLRSSATTHGTETRMLSLIQHCVTEMRNVSERSGDSGAGLDAKALLVVDFDNVNLPSSGYFTAEPAPQPGDPLHYDSFIGRLCQVYARRFVQA